MKNYAYKKTGSDGTIYHYNSERQWHRLGGPAIIYMDGSQSWYVNGKAHRLDGPAGITKRNLFWWYINSNHYTKSGHNRIILFSILEPQRIDLNPIEE